jgi:hypothetical protein
MTSNLTLTGNHSDGIHVDGILMVQSAEPVGVAELLRNRTLRTSHLRFAAFNLLVCRWSDCLRLRSCRRLGTNPDVLRHFSNGRADPSTLSELRRTGSPYPEKFKWSGRQDCFAIYAFFGRNIRS